MRPTRALVPALIGLVLIGLVLMAGCSGGDAEDSRDSRAMTVPTTTASARPTEAAAVVLSKKQAAAALLAVGDLPTGWSEDDSDSDPDKAPGKFTPASCQKMSGSASDFNTLAEASYTSGGLLGPNLSEEIYVPTGQSPKERLESLRQAMGECRSYSIKDKDGTSKVKLSALSFPELGDATLAVRGKITSSSFSATDDVVYVAVGGVVVRLDSIGVGQSLSGADLEGLVRKAVAKVTAG